MTITQAARPEAWLATPRAPDGPLVQQPLEDGRLVLLAGREQDGQPISAPLRLDVHLGDPSAVPS